MSKNPVIGVLALQGAVMPHKAHIEAAGGIFKPVKTPEEIGSADAFIIPGGESTTMLKIIEHYNLWDVLAGEFKTKPVWGVCAGTILMAETVENPPQKSFNLLPITVERNAYGRQLQSAHYEVNGYPVSFIRAPVIKAADPSVTIKAEHEGNPVWIEKGPYMATTFHPELTLDFPSPMHEAFVKKLT